MKNENDIESVSGNIPKCPDCGSTMVEEHHYPGMFYCEACAIRSNPDNFDFELNLLERELFEERQKRMMADCDGSWDC